MNASVKPIFLCFLVNIPFFFPFVFLVFFAAKKAPAQVEIFFAPYLKYKAI